MQPILFELDRFAIRIHGRLISFLLLGPVGLCCRGQAVGIAQAIPKDVAGGIDLIGFGQVGDRGLVIFRSDGLVGGVQLALQRLDGVDFLLLLGLLLLQLLLLFLRQPLTSRGRLLLLLQIEIESIFVQLNLEAFDKVQRLVGLHVVGALVQGNVVLAGRKSEGKILALFVGFESVFLPVVQVGINHDGVGDGIALGILAGPFYRPRSLSKSHRRRQGRGENSDQENCKMLLHIASRQQNIYRTA